MTERYICHQLISQRNDSRSKREKLLEDAVACGFEGVTAVDGQDGWDILQEHKEEVSSS